MLLASGLILAGYISRSTWAYEQLFKNCNDHQLSILQCIYKSSEVYEMHRDDTVEDYHDFSVIFAIALMELFSK